MTLRLQNALYFIQKTVAACLGRLAEKCGQGVTVLFRVVGAFLVLFHALLEEGLRLPVQTTELLLVQCAEEGAGEQSELVTGVLTQLRPLQVAICRH